MYINVCVFKREIESVECVAGSVSKRNPALLFS